MNDSLRLAFAENFSTEALNKITDVKRLKQKWRTPLAMGLGAARDAAIIVASLGLKVAADAPHAITFAMDLTHKGGDALGGLAHAGHAIADGFSAGWAGYSAMHPALIGVSSVGGAVGVLIALGAGAAGAYKVVKGGKFLKKRQDGYRSLKKDLAFPRTSVASSPARIPESPSPERSLGRPNGRSETSHADEDDHASVATHESLE